jgi:hypothetical protein
MKSRQQLCWLPGFVWALAFVPAATAIESQNVIMGVDAMVMHHQGLFRAADVHDGYNTFSFGPTITAPGSLGRFKSFYLVDNVDNSQGGLGPSPRLRSFTPEHWNGAVFQTAAPLDITSAYFPVIDRATFGAMFDPDEYQIEVKFKPNLAPFSIPNEAATFGIGIDQVDGFVLDAETGLHKRAAEGFGYTIGSEEVPINTWYASAPKDANGFATWTVPITSPSYAQRSYYYNYGDGTFRTENVVSGSGRVQNPDLSWSDVIDGPDFDQFGSPLSSLNTPNGLGSIGISSAFDGPDATRDLSIEVKSIAVTRIDPGPIVARIDAHSGFTYRFGSGFTRGTTAAPIPVPGDPFGLGYIPVATDQISRFDENGMTNLMLNMRTPDNAGEVHRFVLRDAPGTQSFDGTTATVNIRAKLLGSNTATTLTIVAKDLDGNDNASSPFGADEYTYNVDLGQLNSSTFTTISIPLTDFSLSAFIAGPPSSGPFGFTNAGDGLRTSFDLYEFGGLIAAGGGLLGMELEYLEIRLPDDDLDGDFDEDGDVDGRDFLVWQRAGSPSPLSAGDLADWQANYGTGGLAAVAAVPEPNSVVLIAACGIMLIGRQRVSRSA